MRGRLLWTIPLLLGPLLCGTVLTVLWWLLDPERSLVIVLLLHRLPLVLGVGVAAIALVVWATTALAERRSRAERERLRRDLTASRHRLVSRLDHEIKNPLQGIRVALADAPSDRQRASIDAQSRRLEVLLRDLRKVGEVEHMPLELSEVDLVDLSREAVAAAKDLPGAAERRWNVAFPTAPRPLPTVSGDEDLLFLALMNVLTNAVKYSGPNDAIEVRGRVEDLQVVLEVADTGRGITADEQELVWEELGRSQEARDVDGSGLGLPMVRAVLQRHGGCAELESWRGEGSTFSLRLPLPGRTGQR
ncbi:sensor histidine kinase [Brachybacterium sp. AOP43-C2-M15]|uniref:sensor histidine kinase n=1 Tax=Brachybacterium sp. AOP43-C2-M15 TaxID=3457661 RepID=UPI0040335EDA